MKLQAAPNAADAPGIEIPFPAELQQQYLISVTTGSAHCRQFDFGYIIDQQIPVGPHTIQLFYVVNDRPVVVYACQDTPLIGILYVTEGSYAYLPGNGQPEIRIHTGSYSPYYTPAGANALQLDPGVSGAIHVLLGPDNLVKGMASISPPLKSLLTALAGNFPNAITPGILPTNEAIQKSLSGILGYEGQTSYPEIYFQGILYTLINELKGLPDPPSQEDTSARERVKKAYAFIIAQPNIQTCTIELLSERMQISKSNLRKLFTEMYQQSVHQFVKQQCLQKAAGLLLEDASTPIKNIAAAVGYANPSNFSNAFKATFGVYPGKYRKSV